MHYSTDFHPVPSPIETVKQDSVLHLLTLQYSDLEESPGLAVYTYI